MAKGKKGGPRITDRMAWKAGHTDKLHKLLEEYPKCFVVKVDNVGSKQMQEIRQSLRGHAVIFIGKNTIIRRAVRLFTDRNPDFERLNPHIRGNVGFVFTKEDLNETREKILLNRRPAPAKAGAIAPNDVFISAQNTGLPPEKTSFFQALSIPTKINRGTIEILSDVHLLKVGQKVGASEATLLNMLKIQPFSYGLVIEQVYEGGAVFTPAVLDITNESLLERINEGIGNVAGLALGLGYPTLASIKHSLLDGIKNLLSITLESNYSFPAADKFKEIMSDPSKLAAAQAAAAAAAPAAAKPAETGKKEEKGGAKPKEEPKKEAPKKKEEPPPADDDEGGMGLDLFG